jgi:hypothetical protein
LLAKCMLEWTLTYHIYWLVNTCAISWDVNNVNFGMSMIQSWIFFVNVDTSTINEPHHVLIY